MAARVQVARHRVYKPLSVLALGLLAIVFSLTLTPAAESQTRPQSTPRWAVLGDSYISGQGLTPPALDAYGRLVLDYETGTRSGRNSCFRSTASWGITTAQHFGASLEDVLFVACSGATTAHVTSSGQFPLSPAEVAGAKPQLDELKLFDAQQKVDVVVLSIGGNDAGFLDQILECLFQLECDPTAHAAFITDAETGHTPLRDRVGELVNKTRSVAPQATILVAGYPNILPIRNVTCGDVAWINLEKVSALQKYLRLINLSVRDGVNDAGAEYLDISKALKGRHLCALHNTGVNGISTNIFGIMHPTDEGHRAIARYATPKIEAILNEA